MSGVTPFVRWLIALSWTLLVIILLLKPGETQLVREYTFSAFFDAFFVYAFYGWNVIEAIIHVILFFILTAFWYWVFKLYYIKRNALLIVIGIALTLGAVTEVSQYFVNRGSLFIDLLANYSGILLFVLWERYRKYF